MCVGHLNAVFTPSRHCFYSTESILYLFAACPIYSAKVSHNYRPTSVDTASVHIVKDITKHIQTKMTCESGGRAVVIAPSALWSKDHPAGPSKVPLRRIRQAKYPPQRIRRRSVEKDPWRVSKHDHLPSSRVPRPWFNETKSGREKGFRHP